MTTKPSRLLAPALTPAPAWLRVLEPSGSRINFEEVWTPPADVCQPRLRLVHGEPEDLLDSQARRVTERLQCGSFSELGSEHDWKRSRRVVLLPYDWNERLAGVTMAIESDFTTRDFAVIRATERTTHKQALNQRLTHDTLRRVSRAGLLGLAATQIIYFLTGVTILHPAAAVILALVGMSFHRMSTLMRHEIESELRPEAGALHS